MEHKGTDRTYPNLPGIFLSFKQGSECIARFQVGAAVEFT
jgi:hypothetical protein